MTMDCPFCYGSKKFSITNLDGRILWNCYRASCGCRGTYVVNRSVQACQNKLQGHTPTIKSRQIPIPNILANPMHYEHAIKYLKSVNSFDAYVKNQINIKFSPVDNRVLFFMPKNVGAVGRSLDGKNPKWKSYGECKGNLVVDPYTTFTVDISYKKCIVVEDAPSACSVARVGSHVGVSILGTSLSLLQRKELSAYEEVIIALDRDASKKSIRMASKIMTKTKIIFLNKGS